MAYADGNIIIGTSVDVKGMQEGLKKINSSFKSLGKLAVGALSIKVLTNFSEAALNAASDLQEVQNVVDVSFGNMAYKINNFASTTIEKFGMSELAAKQTGGSFMAMGKAIGFNAEQASDMAVSLTALTGDFASFYNISQDYARVAMSAVYTGETETLKRYGIVLTQANLQEFASAHGIDVKVKNMTAAQKAYIRYMYILNATKDVEGDFVRTQNSWANSVRVLQERWKQFLITLGNGLMTVLTPVLQFLNYIVAALIKFVSVLGAVLSKLFGIKWQGVQNSTQGVADATGGLADNADDAADAEDKLGKSTKKAGKAAKQSLAAWDDLNVLQKDTSGSGAGGKGGSGGGAGDFDFDMPDVSSLWQDAANKLKLPDFDSLFDVGRWVSDGITNQLKRIPWDKIYKAADNFGKGLADFLNGLITPELFAEVGKTLANSLNTVFHFLDSFGKEFDWSNFGKSLGAGLNAFMKNLDWRLILDTAKTWGTGIANAINSFFKETDFYSVGYTIAQMLNTAIQFVFSLGTTLDWAAIGKKLADAVNGFFDTFNFKQCADSINAWVQGIAEMIKEFLLNIDWKKVFKGLYEFVSNLDIKTVALVIGAVTIKKVAKWIIGKDVFGLLKKAIIKKLTTDVFPSIGTSIKTIVEGWATTGSIHDAFVYTFGTKGALWAGLGLTGGGLIGSILNGISILKEGLSPLKGIIAGITGGVTGLGLVILGLVSGPIGLLIAAIVAVAQIAIPELIRHWDDIKQKMEDLGSFIGGAFIDAWNNLGKIASDIGSNITGAWNGVSGWFSDNVSEPIKEHFQNAANNISQNSFVTVGDVHNAWSGTGTWFSDNVTQPIKKYFEDMNISEIFSNTWNTIKDIWGTASGWFNDTVIIPVTNFFIGLGTSIGTIFSNCWDGIVAIWVLVSGWFYDNVIYPIVNNFESLKQSVNEKFNTLWSLIKDVWNKVSQWFYDTVIKPLTDKFDEFKKHAFELFSKLWEDIKGVWEKVSKWFDDNVITPITDLIDDFKSYITDTIIPAIRDGWDNACDAIGGFFTDLWDGVKQTTKAAINWMLGKIESFVNFFIDAINGMLSPLNKVVSKAGELTGNNWEGIASISHISIPRLAQGAVIPPNKEFMAMLGDQKSGTNIEAPLDTIVQAMRQALSSMNCGTGNQEVTLEIDGRTLAHLTVPYNLDELNRRGYNVSVLEGN